ncbi:MAG: succinate dehydrogenase, cytochrome b556 subunit [Gammaproteobacteria bacterium]|nr:succinate dehydrogenase, cytochrome b556 subunit [Gammaproteobacteria bacterium]
MRPPHQKGRPKYLDLLRIKLPITGIVSIGHRASGVFLVLSIPVWLYLLDMSLSSEQGYRTAQEISNGFLFTLMAIVAFWSLMHHFFAGIRFLLLDLDVAIEKEAALKAARLVFILEGISMVFVIGWLL